MTPDLSEIRIDANPIIPDEALCSDSSIGSSIYWLTSLAYQALTSIPEVCISKIYDYCVDGDKSWKRLKYDLSLKAIAKGFEKDHLSLDNLRKDFEAQESSSMQTTIICIIDLLIKNSEFQGEDPRIEYRNFIDLLRTALSDQPTKIEYIQFLEKICLYRFTEVHLYPFCNTLIDEIVKEGIKVVHQLTPIMMDEILKKTLSQIPLVDQFLYITAAPQAFKAPYLHLLVDLVKGGCNIAFDAQRRSNTPYVLFDFEMNSKTIRVLRVGSPTMQRNDYETATYEGKATIVPEFVNLIKTLSSTKMGLLYISCQDNLERYCGTEHERNSALLELYLKYKDTFNFAIFPHDTTFYYQKAPFDTIDDSFTFRENFIKQMRSTEQGFYFSDGLVNFDDILDIMNEVHFDLFSNKPTLNIEERQNFIEICYTRFTLYFLKKTGSNFLINSCKDSADRAAIRNALLQYLLLIFYKKELCETELNALYTYIHAGAFLVKKRALNSRLNRIVSILNLLESKTIRDNLNFRKEAIGVEGDQLFIKDERVKEII